MTCCRIAFHVLVAILFVATVSISPAVAADLSRQSAEGATADVIAEARRLSSDGRRPEALSLLRAHLARNPDDTDARVLLGTMLSWEGQYDAARKELQRVLQGNPAHGDALPALINVELWSDRPERAEQLASRGIRERPGDTTYLLAHARALQAQKREREALQDVERVLVLEPSNEQGHRLRRSLREALRFWQVGFSVTYDRFAPDRDPWQEGDISLKRQTRGGAIIGRAYKARRFGKDDEQFEIETYPRFRPGSYASISAAWAPEHDLYPHYRFAVDFWQSVGWGLEASGGFRRLHFTDDVDIYTVTLGKYHGNWYVGARSYIVPGGTGTSASVHAWVRKFFGEGFHYVTVRYGRGAAREEIRNAIDVALLRSDSFSADTVFPLGAQFELGFRGGVSREERVDRDPLRQYSFTSSIGYKF